MAPPSPQHHQQPLPPTRPAPAAAPAKAVPAALAPMEGVTNFPMRLWMYLASAPSALATPFLRVTATHPHRELPRAFAPELTELRGSVPYPLVAQLMATDGDEFLRAAELLLPLTPFVELNCGCPAPTCTGKGAGSSLLRDPDEFAALARTLTARLGAGRLAVKMRTGYASDLELPRLLSGIAELPLARLAVHGRTRPDGYRGSARWELIESAARAVRAGVAASGDVVDAASLSRRLAAAPGVASVLVGRGALRNPWVFEELRSGTAAQLCLPLLLRALAVFGMLHELYAERLDALLGLVRDGLLADICGTSLTLWDQTYRRVALAHYGRIVDLEGAALAGALPLARHSLGRVKLVWNYLRSSLPPPYFAPALMRSADLGALLAGVRAIHAASGAPAWLALRHQPELDWLYAGGKAPVPTLAPPP